MRAGLGFTLNRTSPNAERNAGKRVQMRQVAFLNRRDSTWEGWANQSRVVERK